MNKYLVLISLFFSIPIFSRTGYEYWESKKRVYKYEKKYDWQEDDDYFAIKEFKGQNLADKAKEGLRGNYGGWTTSAIADKDPNFDYTETNEKLGSGSFKDVFLAYRKDLKGKRSEMVVLNKFKKNPGDQTGVFKYYKIFKEKDGLMEVYDIFPDKWWYVTKFYNGDLDKFEKLRPSIRKLNDCAYDIISGLVKLKSQGLYHGDLKPANILYRANKKNDVFCVLADFDGLIYVDKSTREYVGGVYTPAYMDPILTNKVLNREKITARDHFNHDLYSAAISLAEFLVYTGENFRDSQVALDRIIKMNAKFNSSKSKSDYNQWNTLVNDFRNAFNRESKRFKNDYPDLIELISEGI